MVTTVVERNPLQADLPERTPGEHYSSGPVRGHLVVVTPHGWRAWCRHRLVATGPESGARGWAAAKAALGAP